MKKLLVTLTAVLVSVSTFGQGTIVFNNRTGPIDAPVRRPDGTGAGAGISAQLFLVTGAPGAETYTALTPATTFRTTSPAAAFYVNQQTVSVPTVAPGSSATVVMRAWEGTSYDAAAGGNGMLFGQSGAVTISLGGTPAGGGAPLPDAILTGLTGFNLTAIPEPSTLALGLLGAAALLYRRRK
jgi:hypothetical protein